MTKFHIMLILLFGFLLIPGNSFAFGFNSGKHYCKKEVSSKTEEGDCCKKELNSKSKKNECCNNKHSNNKNNGCGGQCGHSNCTSSLSLNFSIIAFNEINFKNNNFNFSDEKQNYFYSEIFLSSGFYSLWLIPKIS